ncbi:hypothetical protein JX265_011967 [Neoarthrinium moseri]|uniref:Uncharacterized protein n=1 Tax=Neoarthrinium moseri TaxID=1658444 RepID=A0A9P9WB92_9PEZI|nr:hypothetical protein JX265_011967 [Neoarthrinium moseri]
MATPNKFSNPDTPAGDCLCGYLHCLVIEPAKAIFCLPCVCVAREKLNREKQNPRIVDQAPAPAAQMQGDASKPRDQWPESWRNPEANGGLLKKESPSQQEKTAAEKFRDGILAV